MIEWDCIQSVLCNRLFIIFEVNLPDQIMKKQTLFAILILSVVLITCKKEEPEPTPTTTNNTTNTTTATCSDGIQNGSETGIDCGGTCTACPTGGTPLNSCAEVVLNSMFGKFYGQIADTSSLGANPNWPYPSMSKYFSVYDSSSADWVLEMCPDGQGSNQWQNWNNDLAYYFRNYDYQYNSLTGVSTVYANGNFGYRLRQPDLSYGEGCNLLVGVDGLANEVCTIFNTYPANPILDSWYYLQFVDFTDSIYIIDVRWTPGIWSPAPHTHESHRDTVTYYLVQ